MFEGMQKTGHSSYEISLNSSLYKSVELKYVVWNSEQL